MAISVILLLVVLVVVFVVVGYVISTYNSLVALKNYVKEAWADIEVQLKRRYDLIPNLVETVKGYAKHEQETLEKVIQARNFAMGAGTSGNMAEISKAENMLTSTMKSLFALSENYPDLKANQNFLQLQSELTETENKLQAARSFYNTNVNTLNIKIEQFPSNLIAKQFKFEKAQLFELSEEEKAQANKAPTIKF